MGLHKHHIIPRHAGGTDNPSNTELITLEVHAQRHKELWEQHGRWQDELAWKTLSGQIGHDEARRKAASLANTGKQYALGCKHPPRTNEWKQKQSIAQTGKKFSEVTRHRMSVSKKGNQYSLGYRHTDEIKKLIGMSSKGRVPWNKGRKMTCAILTQ